MPLNVQLGCPDCPAKPQQRSSIKLMLAEQEKTHTRIFNSMLAAMRPLMGEPPASLINSS